MQGKRKQSEWKSDALFSKRSKENLGLFHALVKSTGEALGGLSHEVVGDDLIGLLNGCLAGSLLLLLAGELVDSVDEEREDANVGCFNLGNSNVSVLGLKLVVAWGDSGVDKDVHEEEDDTTSDQTTDDDEDHD